MKEAVLQQRLKAKYGGDRRIVAWHGFRAALINIPAISQRFDDGLVRFLAMFVVMADHQGVDASTRCGFQNVGQIVGPLLRFTTLSMSSHQN